MRGTSGCVRRWRRTSCACATDPQQDAAPAPAVGLGEQPSGQQDACICLVLKSCKGGRNARRNAAWSFIRTAAGWEASAPVLTLGCLTIPTSVTPVAPRSRPPPSPPRAPAPAGTSRRHAAYPAPQPTLRRIRRPGSPRRRPVDPCPAGGASRSRTVPRDRASGRSGAGGIPRISARFPSHPAGHGSWLQVWPASVVHRKTLPPRSQPSWELVKTKRTPFPNGISGRLRAGAAAWAFGLSCTSLNETLGTNLSCDRVRPGDGRGAGDCG